MKISIIHPSRNRPQQAAATAKAWLSSAKDRGSIEYLLSIDDNEKFWKEYHWDFIGDKYLLHHDNKSAIEAINVAAQHSTGDLIIVVSDDFNTPPYHWDVALTEALKGKSDFLVKTDDGLQPWIITLPIMDRFYYESFGYVYNPEYLHMFADTEMTHVGHMLGKVIELPIKIPHNHYASGKTPKDDINVKNDATWNQGEKVYLDRLLRNFDLKEDEIVNPINQVHDHHLQWLKSKGVDFVTA